MHPRNMKTISCSHLLFSKCLAKTPLMVEWLLNKLDFFLGDEPFATRSLFSSHFGTGHPVQTSQNKNGAFCRPWTHQRQRHSPLDWQLKIHSHQTNHWRKQTWLVVEPTHLKKMLVKLDHFSMVRGEHLKMFETTNQKQWQTKIFTRLIHHQGIPPIFPWMKGMLPSPPHVVWRACKTWNFRSNKKISPLGCYFYLRWWRTKSRKEQKLWNKFLKDGGGNVEHQFWSVRWIKFMMEPHEVGWKTKNFIESVVLLPKELTNKRALSH